MNKAKEKTDTICSIKTTCDQVALERGALIYDALYAQLAQEVLREEPFDAQDERS